MFSHYVIEAGDAQAGLVILERGGFRFYAANPAFAAIEGNIYRSAVEATRAAERLVGRQKRRTIEATAPVPMSAMDGRIASAA